MNDEAGARSDGLMMVSVIFIAAFTYIALTTDPVYTGIGVGDKAPELSGQIYNGETWEKFSLSEQFNNAWEKGDNGTYYLVEFMDTNCSICITAASDKLPSIQADYTGETPRVNLAAGVSVEILAVSISLWDEESGRDYGRDVIEQFRADFEHNFAYMDMQDNSHQDAWGNFGTPTYFIIDPSGIIQYTNLEDGFDVREAMDSIIPRGD